MLTQLKKIVAATALFATVVMQASLAGAWTMTAPTGTPTSSSNQASTVTTTEYCDIYGCNTTSNGSGSNTGSSNTGSTGSSNTGSTGTAASTGDKYCDVYGCNNASNGSSSGSTSGSTGSNTGSTTGTTQTAKPVGDKYCDIYSPCTNGTPSNPTPAKHPEPGTVCDIYSPCEKEVPGTIPSGPGMSLCNDHHYPTDIDGHWAEIYIRRLYDLCILEGYADGSYRPDQNITRAELTKMALYAAGIKPNPGCYDADCGSPFMDLDMWQGSWIRPAWDRKIVQGYSHDRFAPNQAITRAEATKVILASYGFGPMNVSDSFFNDVSGWSTGWIETAHELGIVQGIGNGNFDPERPITRAEAAKIVAKSIEKQDTTIVNN